MRGVADREFSIVQTRPGFGPGGSDEISVLGTGVDHGDGTATVTPLVGLTQRVSVAELTEGHHRFTTELVYADQE
jgi:hypothetical protein